MASAAAAASQLMNFANLQFAVHSAASASALRFCAGDLAAVSRLSRRSARLSIGAMAVRQAMQAEVLQAEIRLDPDDEDEQDEEEEEASERLRVEVLRPELPADDRPPAAHLA